MHRMGTSVDDFFERFPDHEACLEHIFKIKHSSAPCPYCHELGNWSRIRGTRKYQHTCRRQVSVLSATIFARSNLSLMAWFYALLLFANSSCGVRTNFIKRQLGLGIKTAYRVCDLLRLHAASIEPDHLLGGPGKRVYVDELHVKNLVPETGYQRTHAIVLGLRCDNIVRTGIVGDRQRASIIPTIENIVRPGSELVTDAYRTYHCLKRRGWRHTIVNHSIAFHDFRGTTTNPIETYWSNLRRSLRAYGQVKAQNLWKFLAEEQFRFNSRSTVRSNFDILVSQFATINPETLPQIERRFDWRPMRKTI